MTAFPKASGFLFALLMGAVALSGIAALTLAAQSSPVVWATIGFEAVIMVTGLSGVLFALHRSAQGRAIGLFNLGGVLLVAAITSRFAWHTTVNPDAIGLGNSVRFAFKDPWFLSRGALGGLLVIAAIIHVLGTNMTNWRRVVVGVLLSLPLLGLGVYLFINGNDSLFPSMVDLATTLRLLTSLLGLGLFVVLFASGIHLIIKGFAEAGSAEGDVYVPAVKNGGPPSGNSTNPSAGKTTLASQSAMGSKKPATPQG